MNTKIETELHLVYTEYWEKLKNGLLDAQIDVSQLSKPWLVDIVPGYEENDKKVLIVGKEPNGWGIYEELLHEDKEEAIKKLQQKYLDFRQKERWSHTPYWKGAHAIHKALNSTSSAPTFMTSNLIKMNHVKKKRPPKDVEDLICSTFPVLIYEIQMLQPDVVIFFTGPFYDTRIQKTFNDAVFEPIEHFNQRHFARVSQPYLPYHTYRTYHPGFSMRERDRYFNPVVDALKMLVK
jgi:hypothetical protein